MNKSKKNKRSKKLGYLERTLQKFTYAAFVFVEPQTIIALLLTVGILVLANFQNGLIRTILEIFGVFTSSWLIEVSTQRWIQAQGDTFLIKKSGSAIRNLQLIKYKISNVETRIQSLQNKQNKRDFEEIDNLIQNIHKDILNSIGDWADVNPNSKKIVDYFESISQKENVIKQLTEKAETLQYEKEKLSANQTEFKKKIERLLEKTEEELGEAKERLNQEIQSRYTTFSGTISGPTIVNGNQGTYTTLTPNDISIQTTYPSDQTLEAATYLRPLKRK